MKFNKETDWDLLKLSDKDLEAIPLEELQRIRKKRWAHGMKELEKRAAAELTRRDPRNDWRCVRCNKPNYHQKEIRVSGGFLQSFFGWERNKYHALICNYCGKAEFYSVQMSASEDAMGLLGS